MKITRKQLRRMILKEFYARGNTNSYQGETIDSKAWLRAFKEAGVEVPRSYHYSASHKINPTSNYKGAWGIEYDAMADSGGPFREDLERRAIEIHNEMKWEASRKPTLSSKETESRRQERIRTMTDDDYLKQIGYIMKLSKDGSLTTDEAFAEIKKLRKLRDEGRTQRYMGGIS